MSLKKEYDAEFIKVGDIVETEDETRYIVLDEIDGNGDGYFFLLSENRCVEQIERHFLHFVERPKQNYVKQLADLLGSKEI